MAPPFRHPFESQQPRRLGRDAVRGDQFLLLADGSREAERVSAEPEHADRGNDDQRTGGAGGDPSALAPAGGSEDREREHYARRGLHADRRHDCDGGAAKAGSCAGRKRKRSGEQQQHERVVMGARHRELEQHRVEPHEHRSHLRRAPHPVGRARDQRDRSEACENGDRLQCPDPPSDTQRDDRVGQQREQRPVWRVLKRPADEPVQRVQSGLRRDVGIGVQAVQRPEAREAQVAEHVLGDQRRPKQQSQARERDGRCDRPPGERSSSRQRQGVAAAHDQRQQLKTVGFEADAETEAVQRPGQPARPAAASTRDVTGRVFRGAGRQAERREDDRRQPGRAGDSQRERRAAGGARRSALTHRGR
jgi:hypothetical protein